MFVFFFSAVSPLHKLEWQEFRQLRVLQLVGLIISQINYQVLLRREMLYLTNNQRLHLQNEIIKARHNLEVDSEEIIDFQQGLSKFLNNWRLQAQLERNEAEILFREITRNLLPNF